MKVRALLSSFIRAVVCIGAVSGGLQQFAASPQLLETPLHLTPSEIEIYKGAQTLIDWTPRQIHHCPFLRKLRPTGSQDQLPMVLERVGQTVTLLFHDFPRIACDEVVSEAHPEQRDSLSPEGVLMRETSETTERQKLRYVVIPGPVGDVPTFEEYRTDLKGNRLDASSLSGRFMLSSNYTSTCLYFSPADQRDNRFRHFGIQTIRERECHVVGFAQEPERVHRVARFQFQALPGGKYDQTGGVITAD